ncbi:MAG: Fe-Mn family superoxide dismutase [Patescibacteria group bacterium]
MTYQPKKYDQLIGTQGFSDTLLKNHFTLYEGYVTNVNKIAEAIAKAPAENKLSTPEYNELKRRFGWEWNGMRLHELYFENFSKEREKTIDNLQITRTLAKQFESYDNWLKDFKATGTMRGIGWTILYRDPSDNRLFNAWVNEHDMGHLAGCAPLLVLDVFEHAYTLDYGLKRADYIEAFMNAVDWNMVERRF